ncbi:MAG: hypothetical protein J5518_08480 [Lachnospiraceae bacterium]|nr:hypothetical protein [Lachnospiraceae bacterium]
MKNLCRAVIAIAAVIGVYCGCCRILTLKSEDGIKQMQSYYLQKENTVDALLLGSSHIYCDINTGILWDEYGISAFDLGGAEQPYWNSYYFLKEALKTQTPGVIVLDITIPGIRSVDLQPEVWSVTNLYGMKWNKNRLEATKVSTLDKKFEMILNPMNVMHTRYDELKKDDFVDENRSIDYKGFDYRETVVPFETRDMSDVTETMPMTEKEETYFRKIIEYTKEKNIPLLLVSVPFPVYRYEDAQKIYNYEFQIAEEENIAHIDFNKDGYYEKIGLDFQKDLADEFHLNVSGNRKFSTYLGQYLQSTYSLQDHRGDPLYASWDKNAAILRQEVAVHMLNEEQPEGEYLKDLQNDQFITVISLGREAENAEFISKNRDALKSLGVDAENPVSGELLILSGGKALYASSDEEQRQFMDLDDMKLLLVREGGPEDGKTKFFVNEEEHLLNSDGVKILVYDRQLKKIVNEAEF